MRYSLLILFFTCAFASYQPTSAQHGGGGKRGGFSLSNLTSAQTVIPDSVLMADSTDASPRRLNAYQLTPVLGDFYESPVDTLRLNTANSTFVEARSLSIGYLGNLGSPAQTRIFRERGESRDFIFAEPYSSYIITPSQAQFYETKVPYTNLMYTTGGGSLTKEEELKGILTMNFGKHLNVGGEFDYIYARGYYQSNSSKIVNYRVFASYQTDRYEAKAYFRNFSVTGMENGGLQNDSVLTDPDRFSEGRRGMTSRDFPVRYINVSNKVSNGQFYLTHRYNLGFYRDLGQLDEDGNPIEKFIPVSSIIHTVDYEQFSRQFNMNSSSDVENAYPGRNLPNGAGNTIPNDSTTSWSLKNTVALSLREGFQDWAKFGLTGFIRLEKRRFRLPTYDVSSEMPNIMNYHSRTYDEFSTFIGAQLSKRLGSLITYDAQGELCILGDDIGEFRASAVAQSKFKLFGKDATVKIDGSIMNYTPAFYLRHNRTRYFAWDNAFSNIQQFYVGGEVFLESTRTRLAAGLESIQNYIYAGAAGLPVQNNGNIQVISARLNQDFRYRALGWDNELCYQLTSDSQVLPLPSLSVYSNLYVAFKLVKVLTVQLGVDMRYFTAYSAPYYEPATQMFQVQDEVKVGNYPLINAYVNFHLKQARFFVEAYNLGSQFIAPNYFSLAHYPLNPMMLKMGVSVMFNN